MRVVTEYAWHSLFAKNLFIEPKDGNLQGALPGFTVIDCPSVKADPATDGTNSETFVVTGRMRNSRIRTSSMRRPRSSVT